MSSGSCKTKRPWLVGALAVLVIAGGVMAWRNWFETYHFATVTPGILYRDGNRGMREFENAIESAGIRTIVMLNDDAEVASKEKFQQEMQFCQDRGLKLVRIPVKLGGRPTSQDVQAFLRVVNDPANHPVLVHCAQGVRRTAMMVAAYQESQLKFTNDQAKAAILPWGRPYEKLADIRGFIDDYNPIAGTVANPDVQSELDEID